MKQKLVLFLVCLLSWCCFLGVGWSDEANRYPVMRPDNPTWLQWVDEYERAPFARLVYDVSARLNEASRVGDGTSMDLVDLIEYDPTQRNQGGCGNCWVWAGTGVMEIAHELQDGVLDRHSIQYLNSCRTGFACCGGSLGGFADWYNLEGQALPWDNTNASFADGGKGCSDGASDIACGDISTTPNFPIDTIGEVTIETHDIDHATAIGNIKNILNQSRGIYFSFSLPNSTAWGDFFDFWDGVAGETEVSLWGGVNDYCGTEWDETAGEAGSHAVLILGYNDDDDDAANHYWLALNSWGTAGGVRPNGFFRIPMNMDYDCVYPDTGNPDYSGYWAFGFQTLAIEFGNSPPTSFPGGPYEEDCMGVTTSITLDGSGSSDPESDPLTFEWSTDCAEGGFDNYNSVSPTLTIDTSPGCSVECSVFLAVSDGEYTSENTEASVRVADTDVPEIYCPSDVTIECDESIEPGNTGTATATDTCAPFPSVNSVDSVVSGACPAESTITRLWTATDECGNSASCNQIINVVDTTAPVISCNNPSTISPNEAPISFTASAIDNCDTSPLVEILGYNCFKYTKKGKIIDKGESCVVSISEDTVTINDSGGVGDNIRWSVSATDCSGNESIHTCGIQVVNPND